jgi:hypothetical protein
MTIEIPDEVCSEGVSRAVERILASEELVNKIANAICQRFELLRPEEAAAILEVTPRTLAERHVAWGLDKSFAFGATNPRYFLSQILTRAREKIVQGCK